MAVVARGNRVPEEEWECSICYDRGIDPVILHTHKTETAKIDHIFHRSCIKTWLDTGTSKVCPLCSWKWEGQTLKAWTPPEEKNQTGAQKIEDEPIKENSGGDGWSIYSTIGSIVLTILVGVAVVWALMNGIPLVG